MNIRRGHADETWALAHARDRAALEHVAVMLTEHAGIEAEGRRARAFALALAGDCEEALAELRAAKREASEHAVDVARVHFLARKPGQALAALRRHDEPSVHVVDLALDCVELDRRLWRHGLAVAFSGSRGADRIRMPFHVFRAWRRAGRGGTFAPASP